MKDPTAPEIKPIEPKTVTVNTAKTALLVLELTEYCADSDYMATPIVAGVTRLLEKARAAGALVAFTVPQPFLGKPYGKVYSGFNKKASEAVFSPIGFDKFSDGKMKTLLDLYDIDTLIITGCKVNMAILYTATKAAAEYKYNIIIPVDGIIGTTDYEKEYALYQFRTYPIGSTPNFTFTELDMINFSSEK